MEIDSLMSEFAILIGRTIAQRWLRYRDLSRSSKHRSVSLDAEDNPLLARSPSGEYRADSLEPVQTERNPNTT